MACTTDATSGRRACSVFPGRDERTRLTALIFLCVFTGVQTAAAQQADRTAVTEVATGFVGARALDVDPRGRLYVLDARRATVTQLDSSGQVLAVWGGAGSGDARFDEPTDLDATNGLELFVADTGNRRIKRFSGEFVPLESIPLNLPDGVAGVGDAGRSDADPFQIDEGRPAGVRLADDGSLYALDTERNVVVKWTRNRRLERVFGGYEDGDGALMEPTSIALGPEGRIYVGDAARRTVLLFDAFGSFVRTLGGPAVEEPIALEAVGRRLIVVQPNSLVLFSLDEGLEEIVPVDVGEPLVDATVLSDRLLVLTSRRLLRLSF